MLVERHITLQLKFSVKLVAERMLQSVELDTRLFGELGCPKERPEPLFNELMRTSRASAQRRTL